eukprot:CAMPEP_0119497564 /NCGR_PEP_ID=MMETSP1344-20130328/20577_1 /TAXON_ID=236787 /ORGANISM="Florenciella parvula, Strain CCMP2471" /LENGTH=75 /DNA_ID=CAMNT_0007533359 /DNA_START=95 /DNA_END=318 /DNA_ORIENTATION=-
MPRLPGPVPPATVLVCDALSLARSVARPPIAMLGPNPGALCLSVSNASAASFRRSTLFTFTQGKVHVWEPLRAMR